MVGRPPTGKHMPAVQHDTTTKRVAVNRTEELIIFMHCFVLPSKERKTLGRGCWRQDAPVERRERARRASAIAGTRRGLADPSGPPMSRNQEQSLPPVVGGNKFLFIQLCF